MYLKLWMDWGGNYNWFWSFDSVSLVSNAQLKQHWLAFAYINKGVALLLHLQVATYIYSPFYDMYLKLSGWK